MHHEKDSFLYLSGDRLITPLKDCLVGTPGALTELETLSGNAAKNLWAGGNQRKPATVGTEDGSNSSPCRAKDETWSAPMRRFNLSDKSSRYDLFHHVLFVSELSSCSDSVINRELVGAE